MVLVNTLTVEAINTALIALQRGQSIVVGGEKPSTTVNNITISNGGGGSSGGSGLDFTPQINALDKRVGLLEKAEEVLRLENERQNERLTALEGLGITDFYFDDTSRELTIELANGEVFDTEVTGESFSMDIVNGELIIRIGEQVHTVTLPVGSQADWTETDSDDPSFIKHKIPIWITSGSADDNMSPIDSVTDGSMRPVTSNAVYDKHYLTSADITNQVTVNNMQSVSSNAVAQAFSWQTPSLSQALADFGFQFNAGYSGNFGMSNYAKTDNLLIVGISIDNVTGANIGTSSTAVIGTCNIRPKNNTGDYGIIGIAIDYFKTSTQIRFGLMTDGRFAIFESNGVTNGSNAIRGYLVIPI